MIRNALVRGLLACGLVAAAMPVQADEAPANSSAGPDLSAPGIEYTGWQLDNGLTVIALPDETTSTVTTSLWYSIGSKLGRKLIN